MQVDLADAGLYAPVDVPLASEPDPYRWYPELTDRDEPLTITHTGDRARGGRIAVLVSLVVVAVLAVASAIAISQRGDGSPGGGPGTETASADPTGSSSAGPGTGGATLRAQTVQGAAGDVMRAVARGRGTLVAVGFSSSARVPRAWRLSSGKWAALPGPTAGTRRVGAMNGVAAVGGAGFIAVGWTAAREIADPRGTERQATVWQSGDGATWRVVAQPQLGELFDVAALPNGGGFVTSGVDWKADPQSGDGALLTSRDGRAWASVRTSGLDGPGPTYLQRILPGTRNGVVAIGSRLEGAVTRSGLWTSTDLRSWTESALLPDAGPGTATAAGLTQLGDGRLLVVGQVAGGTGGTIPVAWTGTAPAAMTPAVVRGGTGSLLAVIADAGGRGPATTVGVRPANGGTVPAAWGITVR
jgi:hypothetical protein